MQKTLIVLSVGLAMAACDATGPTDGALIISTSTVGRDPDLDGYMVKIDDRDSLSLEASGTAEVPLRSGHHRLRLLGVAGHCSVAAGTTLEVEVPAGDAISVSFEINCPATALNITTTTTGLDLPWQVYRVQVDGQDRAFLHTNETVLTRLDPGTWTVSLTDLPSNCTPDGPVSQTVTVGYDEVVPVGFTIVCTATSGVIAVVLQASGPDVRAFQVTLDDGGPVEVWSGYPEYLSGVSAGDHGVALLGPPNCTAPAPQQVAITTGGLIRDTVEVNFSVTCTLNTTETGTVRISAPTTGPLPGGGYQVWYTHYGYWDYGGPSIFLGDIEPNGTLIAELPATGSNPSGGDPYWYWFWLESVPGNCSVTDPHTYPVVGGDSIPAGGTLDLEFAVTCH